MAASGQLPGDRTTIKIDPSGDVILQVGDQDHQANLLVSSKVLSIVSRVFAVMFSHEFKEGQSLRSSDVCEVPMPEDDPNSMILLCNCLHFRTDQIPTELSYSDLEAFAILCDKYDCTKAISAWAALWLRKWETETCEEGFEALLFVVYALDSPAAFRAISKRAILYQVGEFDVEYEGEGIQMVPDGLIWSLELERRKVIASLHKSIEDLATPALLAEDERSRSSSNVCPFRESSTLSYFRGLKNCGLWPLSEAFCESNLSSIFDKLSFFKETNTKLQTVNPSKTSCTCEVCKIRLKPLIRVIRADHLSSVKGLCLDCVKSKSSTVELHCRVEHP